MFMYNNNTLWLVICLSIVATDVRTSLAFLIGGNNHVSVVRSETTTTQQTPASTTTTTTTPLLFSSLSSVTSRSSSLSSIVTLQSSASENSADSSSSSSSTTKSSSTTTTTSSSSSDTGEEFIRIPNKTPSSEWELDCYSRPVVMNGKKLWEVLITDATGSFRYRKELPSNQVNSKTLRKTVEELIESSDIIERPSIIRFFRGAMFNMINIALLDLDVISKPSRCTYALAQWLKERNTNIYPQMEGFRANMVGGTGPSFLDVRTPVKLPDALRGEQYAFVSLPLAEFLPGGGVNEENIGVGKLCPLDDDTSLPADAFVQGIVILTQRPKALASWMAGTEIVAVSCDLRKRQMVLETDIDNQFLMARLNDRQRAEGAAFEEGKEALNGLHFISVQRDEDDDPAGFWLFREIPSGI